MRSVVVLRFGHLPRSALVSLAALFAREESRREGTLLDDLSQAMADVCALVWLRSRGGARLAERFTRPPRP